MPLDLDALRAKKARRSSNGWQAKEGDNIIRFLPHVSAYFTSSISELGFQFRSHFLKSEGMDTAVIRCPRDAGQECGICGYHKANKDTQDPNLKKVIDQIRVGERHLFNILNMNDVSAGIQPYETGPKLYDDVLSYVANPAWGDLLHPETGRNFSVILTPQGKSRSGYNEYQLQPHPTPQDIRNLLPASWLEKLDELEANIPPYPEPALLARWADILGCRLPGAPAPVVTSIPVPVAPVAPVAPAPVPVAATTAPAPQPYPPYTPPVAPTPVAAVQVPVAPLPPVPVPQPPAPVGDTPVLRFVAAVGLTAVVKAKMPPTDATGTPVTSVPHCFSEGQTRTDIGFNPMRWPCEKGCPVKAACQLKQLGLDG